MSIRQIRSAILLFILLCAGSVSAGPLLRVTFLDIGQGDATLIRTAEKTILIDAGDDRFNSANRVIIPYCKREGIKKIDIAIISHPHRDHFGGFIDLLDAIPIGEFQYSSDTLGSGDSEEGSSDALLYMRLRDGIKAKNIPYNHVDIGSPLNWGKGIKVEVFHSEKLEPRSPAPAALAGDLEEPLLDTDRDPNKISANEYSLIIKATAGQVSYLFTGDAEKGAEGEAVAMFKDKLHCTVLKSGHHGSKTSSTYPFLDMAKPQYGVISVGAKNSFGHPNQETLDKYAFYKMKVFRTDLDGTVDSFTDGKTVQFNSNQSLLDFTKKPEIISLTPNSATIQWATNKNSNSKILYGTAELTSEKALENFVTVHTITLTGLRPSTTYKFQAVSQDERQPEQIVTAEGALTTPAGSGAPLPKITAIAANAKEVYIRKPFQVQIDVKNPSKEAQAGLKLALYHSSMDKDNLLGVQEVNLKGSSKASLRYPVELTWMGKVELIAALFKGQDLIDTSSIVVDVKAKFILVDCAHGNIDFFTGKFAGMRMDLFNKLGYTLRSVSKKFTADLLKEGFILILTDPKEAFGPEELAAIKGFIAKGGSLMLFFKADYKNIANPAFFNDLLQGIGSGIRFNDDEFCDPTNNIGAHWRTFVHVFPDPIISGIPNLLVRSCCSLLNAKMTGLTATKDIHLLATGDEDSYNLDSDEMGDGYVYASNTPILPIPVVAAEDLGKGRVACFGEQLYDDKLYADAQIQTPLFLRQVVVWLVQAHEKTFRDLVSSLDSLDSLEDPEARAIRTEDLRAAAMDEAHSLIADGSEAEILTTLQEFSGSAVKALEKDVRDALQFRDLHQDNQ